MNVWLTRVFETFMMPPGVQLLLLVLVIILLRRVVLARWLLGGVVLFTLLISATGISNCLLEESSRDYPTRTPQQLNASAARAIVVLGGGRYQGTSEYGGDAPSFLTLERLRYAALVHRATGLPILVSGGSPLDEEVTEAAIMGGVLEQELATPVRWREAVSKTTWENAVQSRKILLEGEGIGRIILITHSWHMARSVWSFRQVGFSVIPAPTIPYKCELRADPLAWLPNAKALYMSSIWLHERIGLGWYWLREAIPPPAISSPTPGSPPPPRYPPAAPSPPR